MTDSPNKLLQPGFWLGVGFLAVVLTGLLYSVVAVNDWLEDEQKAPVQDILLSGHRTQINDQQIEHLIRTENAGSFFAIDVDKVHKDIEALPWVYRASVRKRWPNSLKVHLVEQIPAAHWNDDLMLNQYGESFAAKQAELSLPSLFGPGGSEKIALEGLKAMQALLSSTHLSVSELFLSERFAWNLRLSNGISLNLGRTEFIDRLQRFVDLYPLLIKESRAVDYVDLRYDTGFAVGWKTAEQGKQQES